MYIICICQSKSFWADFKSSRDAIAGIIYSTSRMAQRA